jgi:hypothetical protein
VHEFLGFFVQWGFGTFINPPGDEMICAVLRGVFL